MAKKAAKKTATKKKRKLPEPIVRVTKYGGKSLDSWAEKDGTIFLRFFISQDRETGLITYDEISYRPENESEFDDLDEAVSAAYLVYRNEMEEEERENKALLSRK